VRRGNRFDSGSAFGTLTHTRVEFLEVLSFNNLSELLYFHFTFSELYSVVTDFAFFSAGTAINDMDRWHEMSYKARMFLKDINKSFT